MKLHFWYSVSRASVAGLLCVLSLGACAKGSTVIVPERDRSELVRFSWQNVNMPKDVNFDGVADFKDVQAMQLILAEGPFDVPYNEQPTVYADINGDARVEIKDLVFLADSIVPWYRAQAPLDVNGDGVISETDANAIINFLNARPPGVNPLTSPRINDLALDTNGDNGVSPIDALLVINYLNSGR